MRALETVLLCASTVAALGNYTQSFVTYNDSRVISYLTAGVPSNPLMILLHGWPAVAETWHYQMDYFSGRGWYVVAPDMPGYGDSTARNISSDYSNEAVIEGLLALLNQTDRLEAVWIGHDWGAAVASALVNAHPEVVKAMTWLDVPYHTIERGLIDLLPWINRTTYPPDQYFYGQWDYWVFYEESFERATATFDSNVDFSLRSIYQRWNGNTSILDTPAFSASVIEQGGWFGGALPLPPAETVPLNTTVLTEDLLEVLVKKMLKTGFTPADHYYTNDAENRAFNLNQTKNNGTVGVPCLFVEAKYDQFLDVAMTNVLLPMKRFCPNLTLASVSASHWLQLEQPDQVNQAVDQWLLDTGVGPAR